VSADARSAYAWSVLHFQEVSNGRIWYVRFWNIKAGKYTVARSTGIYAEGKKERKQEAELKAQEMLKEIRFETGAADRSLVSYLEDFWKPIVALASNYKKLVGIAETAQANGVKRVSVLRFVPQGRGLLICNHDTLNKSQNLELKNIILDLRNNGFDIRTGSPFNVLLLNTNPKCMAAQDRFIIAPDLNIYPCDAFKQISCKNISPNDRYSNLNEHTVVECWDQSKYFELVRNAILSIPSEPCQSCKNHNLCLAGCLAQKYLYYSSLNKNPDPACLIGA
jgi:radical SAM protein with 4Fe4S-binding SPASM domain